MAEATHSELTKVELFNFKRNLKDAFEAYQEIDDANKQKLLDYLIDGANPSCLLDVKVAMANTTRPFFDGKHGGLQVSNTRHGSKMLLVFHQHAVPGGYYLRLAEWLMLHAPLAKAAAAGEPGLPDWINVLGCAYQAVRGYYSAAEKSFLIRPIARELSESQFTDFIRVLVEAEGRDYTGVARTLVGAGDVAELLLQRPEVLCNALSQAAANCVEATLNLLVAHKANFTMIMPTVVDLLCGGGKKVKAIATQMVSMQLEAARTPLCDKLKKGSPSERTASAETLAKLYGATVVSELNEALSVEKGARLRQTLEELIRQIDDESSTVNATANTDSPTIELPPIDMPEGPVPLPEGFRPALAEMLAKADIKFEEQFQRQLAFYNSSEKHRWMSKPARLATLSDGWLEELCLYLEGTGKKPIFFPRMRQALAENPIDKWFANDQLHLLHIVRLMDAVGWISLHNNHMYIHADIILAHRSAQDKPYGLREIDAAIAIVLNKPGLMVQAYLGYARSNFDLEDSAVWPLFHEHSDKLRDAVMGMSMGQHDYYIAERRRSAIAIASMLPVVPKPIENALWGIALGEAKTDRPLARRALSKVAGRLERGLQAIQDGKQSIRIAGAVLLAELGDSAAVEPLKKALKTEKQETVKGSLLQAIELLGGDVEEFLGRRKQLLDAKKALEKKMPKGMEWFPLDALPTVRWAEDDKPVAAEIVRCWVIQSVQFKLPTCGALLRRAMGMCRSDDAAALAKFVLSAWIGYDTQVPNQADTLAAATERAKKEFKTAQWIRDYYKTEEAFRDSILQQMQGQFLNSASGEKGALAVVAAGGDKHCVRIIEKYIRTYHGHRLAQSKALLEVLGWIDEPLAIQVLLSIGNRFRTAAIRKRAAEMVQELADRKGWTMEQLADRTIPDAGFVQVKDENGKPIGKRAELVLDYGARKFTVIMNDDLEPVISRDDGKEVKALPAAAKDDDPELVKAAKAEFTAAKKTVKDVVKLLAEQLYEAVCSQRTWVASEWKAYLATHPIAGALCRRVIWRAQPTDQSANQSADPTLSRTALAAVGDTIPATNEGIFFRPLEDGTFTDVEDNSVEIADTDIITVAHSSLISSEAEQAWIDHLKDYDVPRLFVQFGRHTYRLPESDFNKTDIDAFKGHMLTTFLLRNKATKLGWQRGAAQDGGSFSSYFKPFRASGITAMLEFTGSFVPEQDIAAGIRSLYFVPIRGNEEEADTWNPPKMKLAKVPAILISECYNDVRDIAAEGTGFDPEWEKKGLW